MSFFLNKNLNSWFSATQKFTWLFCAILKEKPKKVFQSSLYKSPRNLLTLFMTDQSFVFEMQENMFRGCYFYSVLLN